MGFCVSREDCGEDSRPVVAVMIYTEHTREGQPAIYIYPKTSETVGGAVGRQEMLNFFLR